MKYFKTNFINGLLAIIVSLYSCKKDHLTEVFPTANINVINSIASLSSIKADIGGLSGSFVDLPGISLWESNGGFNNGVISYGVKANEELLINIVRDVDTSKTIYSKKHLFKTGQSYSLVLTGDADEISSIFLEDITPKRADDTMGIRFVNASPDSRPLSINIAGQPVGSMVKNLSYKASTEFISLPLTSTAQYYIFEFHDAVSGDLVYEFLYDSFPRNKYESLIMRGFLYGGDGLGFEVARFKHY